jgi:hypothetical protein
LPGRFRRRQEEPASFRGHRPNPKLKIALELKRIDKYLRAATEEKYAALVRVNSGARSNRPLDPCLIRVLVRRLPHSWLPEISG